MAVQSAQPPRHIALTYPIAIPWVALFMRGVMDFAKGRGEWSFTVSPPTLDSAAEEALSLRNLKGWPGDGVIAAITNREEQREARQFGKPVVNIAAAFSDVGVPGVMLDHFKMGQMAADHLLDRGLKRLAYFGIDGLWYSQQRRIGFESRAKQSGVSCDVLEISRKLAARHTWQERVAPLTQWLKGLRPPVGLLAVHDYRARFVVDECQRLGLNVPHDVAVMGVDNDPTVCEFCQPTLTSVSRDPWRFGYETASLLDRLMNGMSPPDGRILIPPEGIVPRQSTDTVAIENVHVAAAAHFIHDHLHEHFDVEQVVLATDVSRRQLEMQFRTALGCTVYNYICRRRCEQAKNLLGVKGRVKFRQIARDCGFSSVERMRLVFARLIGLTPQQYRATELAKNA